MTVDARPIVNLTRGTLVCEAVVIADRAVPRLRGLLGRGSLPTGEGLLLQPAPSIHTAFMRFPIDVIFLDRNLEVVKRVEALGPWRTASARHARAALELAAGQTAARGIEIGDRLGVVTVTTSAGGEAAWTGGEHESPGGAVDAIHVLLVGKDRRFRSVTSALLSRRGCVVTLGERIDLATVRARRGSVDVVVVDADSSPIGAPGEAAKLQMLEPPVGVVLVSDAPTIGLPQVTVLAKWGPFDELYGAITTARPNRHRRRSNGGR